MEKLDVNMAAQPINAAEAAPSRPIRIQVADEDYLVRLGLERTVEKHHYLQLDAVTGNGADAVAAAVEAHPEIVLIDPAIRNIGGMEAVYRIRQHCPDTRIVMLSSSRDPDSIQAAMAAGACSYLSKNGLTEDLGPALRIIHRGGAIFSGQPAWNRTWQQDYSAKAAERKRILGDLSTREKAILQRTVEGLSNSAVARSLHLSEATVKAHLTRIMTRLRVTNRVQLAVLAVRADVLNS